LMSKWAVWRLRRRARVLVENPILMVGGVSSRTKSMKYVTKG
jgi:hypothetical protein